MKSWLVFGGLLLLSEFAMADGDRPGQAGMDKARQQALATLRMELLLDLHRDLPRELETVMLQSRSRELAEHSGVAVPGAAHSRSAP